MLEQFFRYMLLPSMTNGCLFRLAQLGHAIQSQQRHQVSSHCVSVGDAQLLPYTTTHTPALLQPLQ
jgi:hypothetical protein